MARNKSKSSISLVVALIATGLLNQSNASAESFGEVSKDVKSELVLELVSGGIYNKENAEVYVANLQEEDATVLLESMKNSNVNPSLMTHAFR